MVMNLGYVTSSGSNLNNLRSGRLFPKEPKIVSCHFESRCLETIKEFVDTRRSVLATKLGQVCIPDEAFSCFLSGEGVTISLPHQAKFWYELDNGEIK